ncbi:18S rRNA biogenesis protein [Pisolithus croceorrhizus]|nr:18S rRNA biogenesis protein [Pisolithus croceorrhizus]
MASVISYSGHQYLRQRLAVRIEKVRSEDENPGLTDYEVSLLRLLEKVTNGTVVEISVTAGGPVTHDCPLSRSIGYFLEPLADLIRTVTLLHLQLFGISDGLELRIKRRGAPPCSSAQVVKQVTTVNFIEPGKIKRIRGIAHAVRVSPQFSNRMIDAARSPGYGLSLLAESTTSAIHCAEVVSQPGGTPEDVALLASRALLSEIRQGGCVDRKHQCLVLLMMVLGSEDVGRCRMGEPTVRTVQFLRDIRDFFGTSFKIVPANPSDPSCTELMYSCYGTGYVNVNRTLA